MNIHELKKNLEELQISSNDYSLDGTLKPMRTILLFSNPRWVTFEYDEHGNVQDKKEFETENEACQDMLSRLIYLSEFRKRYKLS